MPAEGQLTEARRVWLPTSATFPAVALMEMVPTTSGVGSGVVPPAPWASWTRKYWPGASVVAVRFVFCHTVPVAAAYWTDHPLRLAGDVPRLNSSMKSFVYVAPELPPPP